MSFMRAHQQRVLQVASQQQRQQQTLTQKVDEYRLMLAQMHDDQARLKNIPDHAERNRLGVGECLPKYVGYLRHWLAIGNHHQNDVLTQCVVWIVDGMRWDLVQEFAGQAIALDMPLHWMRRSLAEFVADGVFRALEAEYKVKMPAGEALDDTLLQLFWWILEQVEGGYAQLDTV